MRKPARQGSKLADKGAYMDVSDRRLQVQLTPEAKIASDFSLVRAIFVFAGFVSALTALLIQCCQCVFPPHILSVPRIPTLHINDYQNGDIVLNTLITEFIALCVKHHMTGKVPKSKDFYKVSLCSNTIVSTCVETSELLSFLPHRFVETCPVPHRFAGTYQ